MSEKIKKNMIELKDNLIGIFGNLFINSLFFTTKIETVGYNNVSSIFSSKKFIFALWHSRILLMTYMHKESECAIIVSSSKDGEIISRILQRQGNKTVRGSTSRGGVRALAGLIRVLKQKVRPGAITPDGPRGPRFKCKGGIITLAKKMGYPIVPLTCSAEKIKIFNSWDKFILPYPFTRCRIVYGKPVYVEPKADKKQENICRVALENELNRITKEADLHFNHNIT